MRKDYFDVDGIAKLYSDGTEVKLRNRRLRVWEVEDGSVMINILNYSPNNQRNMVDVGDERGIKYLRLKLSPEGTASLAYCLLRQIELINENNAKQTNQPE